MLGIAFYKILEYIVMLLVFVVNFSLDYKSRKSLARDSDGFEPLDGYFDQKWDDVTVHESDTDGE